MKAWIEKRAKALAKMQEIRGALGTGDEARAMTDAERQEFDAASQAFDEAEAEIQRLQKLEDIEGRADLRRETTARNDHDCGSEVTEETRTLAFRGLLRSMAGANTSFGPEQRAMRQLGVQPAQSFPVILPPTAPRSIAEVRAWTTTTNAGAVEFVPSEFVAQLEIALLQYGAMFGVADIMRTSHGRQMVWPTANDTATSGEQVGEGDATNVDSSTPFDEFILDAYKFSSKVIKLTQELLEDAAYPVEQYVARMIGERIGRKVSNLATLGAGTTTLTGIVTGATAVEAAGTTVAADDILTLQYSIDPAYQGQAAFMCNQTIMLALRKLKDTTNQYLWQPALVAGQPNLLAGKPIFMNQDMSSTNGAGEKILLYGDFSKYKLRQVNDLRVYRLAELYRENDIAGFVGFQRYDGDLMDAGTHPVKVLQLVSGS